MTELREITTGLRFPEGPIAMPDGSVVLVEIERGTLTRVWPDGRKDVVAKTGGGPNGAAIGPDGSADCEFGQRGYLRRQAKHAPRGFNVANDPRTPGLQGTTPTGRPRVPEGQTFTDKPQTGGYKDFPVSQFGGQ